MILHNNAITGTTKYGMPPISRRAKYVDPPPNPTLEYNVAVIKNNIARRYIVIYHKLN